MAGNSQGKAASGTAAPSAGLRWDTAGMREAHCDVASAGAERTGVILNFGVKRGADHSSAEIRIDLRHRIVLDPLAAKHLHELLVRVIAEYDARGHESK